MHPSLAACKPAAVSPLVDLASAWRIVQRKAQEAASDSSEGGRGRGGGSGRGRASACSRGSDGGAGNGGTSASAATGGGGSGKGDAVGLSHLVEATLGAALDKSMRMTNWARRPLVRPQMIYAALDAHCLVRLYAQVKGPFHSSSSPSSICPSARLHDLTSTCSLLTIFYHPAFLPSLTACSLCPVFAVGARTHPTPGRRATSPKELATSQRRQCRVLPTQPTPRGGSGCTRHARSSRASAAGGWKQLCGQALWGRHVLGQCHRTPSSVNAQYLDHLRF